MLSLGYRTHLPRRTHPLRRRHASRYTPETVLLGQRRRLACPPRCRVSPPTPVIYGPRLHRPHEHCTGARGQTQRLPHTRTERIQGTRDSRKTDSRRTAAACTHRTHTRDERPQVRTLTTAFPRRDAQSASRRTLLPQLLHAELETVFRVGTEFHEIADDALDTRREDDQSLPLHAICHLGLNANDGQPTPHALARL